MRNRLAQFWREWRARLGVAGAVSAYFWSAVQRAQDVEWLAGWVGWAKSGLGGRVNRPWGEDLLAILASPYAPLAMMAVAIALIAWAVLRPTRDEAAATPVGTNHSGDRLPPAITKPTAQLFHAVPSASLPSQPTASRQTKREAMHLAGDLNAWADRWDALPAMVGDDFEMVSDFRSQFGDRLEALKPSVPSLCLFEMGVTGGLGLVSDTGVARQIAHVLDSFANGPG